MGAEREDRGVLATSAATYAQAYLALGTAISTHSRLTATKGVITTVCSSRRDLKAHQEHGTDFSSKPKEYCIRVCWLHTRHLPSAAAAWATMERLHGCRLLAGRPAEVQVLAGLLRIAVLRGAACGLTAAEGGQVQRDSMADAISSLIV
jgi:hypothetical protein